MLGIIAANLRRRASRTLLTSMGIALGVATIVALISVAAGLKRTAGDLVHLGQADVGIFQKGAADPTASVLPTSLAARLEKRPDVSAATPLLLLIESIKSQPQAVVFGADPETIKKRTLRVSGIYHAGIFFEDTGAIMPLTQAEQIAKRPGEATTIAVTLAPNVRASAAKKALTRDLPSLQIITTPDDAARAGANSVLIGKGEILIAALALIVGGISVTNIMVLSVLERQVELALLSTVGFSPRQIAWLVLGEGIGLSLIGAAIGLVLGTAGAALLVKALDVSAYVTPDITAWGLGRGLLVGIAIGVFGGLYPAWRVTRLSPARALARV
jgi:putative ABC transport system permease protein